jgi:signal peptidase I
MKTFLREVLGTLVLAIAIFLIIQATLQSSVVIGSSMEPNLHNGHRVLINKVVYSFHEPERGDIVVFTPPDSIASNNDYIKRIIGMPGEVVEIKDGIIYILQEDGNTLVLDEGEYIYEFPKDSFLSDKIPADSYFVLGDNRNNSNDSRGGWMVTRQDIVGKAWLLIWPITEWGLAPNYSLP